MVPKLLLFRLHALRLDFQHGMILSANQDLSYVGRVTGLKRKSM